MGAYIIAEAGVNHNGRLDLAKELCLAAKNAARSEASSEAGGVFASRFFTDSF